MVLGIAELVLPELDPLFQVLATLLVLEGLLLIIEYYNTKYFFHDVHFEGGSMQHFFDGALICEATNDIDGDHLLQFDGALHEALVLGHGSDLREV